MKRVIEVSDPIIKIYTTNRKSHPDYQTCIAVKKQLRNLKVQYEEVVYHDYSDDRIDLILLGSGGGELPEINVRQNGRIVSKSFGYDLDYLKGLQELN